MARAGMRDRPTGFRFAPSGLLRNPSREETMGSVNASVDLKRDNDVAIITIENPPVNALKHAVRAGLIDALKQLKHPAVQAMPLTGPPPALSPRPPTPD